MTLCGWIDGYKLFVLHGRITAGDVRNLGGVSLALWRTVLSLQDVSHRDDDHGERPDYLRFHRRTLSCHLPPFTCPDHLPSGTSHPCDRRHLAGGVRLVDPVSRERSHVPLRRRPERRHAAGRLVRL